MVYNNKKHRERGGIGRHNRLKICRLRGVGVQVPPLVPNEVTPIVAGGAGNSRRVGGCSPQDDEMKQCQFIRTNNEAGSIFVPMPNSWERHQWLKGYFGKECSVVGRVLWSLLTYEYEVMVLIEENGIFREEKKE